MQCTVSVKKILLGISKDLHTCTVESSYNVVGGVQEIGPRYKWISLKCIHVLDWIYTVLTSEKKKINFPPPPLHLDIIVLGQGTSQPHATLHSDENEYVVEQSVAKCACPTGIWKGT